jgi:hypothetical protein
VASIGGAAIGSIGTIALMSYLQETRAAGKAIAGMVATVMGNTITASVFGSAAFAQTAAGRMFQAGHSNALDFYNQVYSGPLIGTALTGLLLFIVGGVLIGIAISASERLPRWAGWVYAITVPAFALSNFLIPVGQTPMSALLFLATLAVAWSAGRKEQRQGVKESFPSVP